LRLDPDSRPTTSSPSPQYAYGCSELLFNPFRYWFTRGPLSKQIITFLFKSNLPVHYKFSSTGYIFSYYAIAIALPLSILNYVLLGVFPDIVDKAYLPSWNVLLAVWVVFTASAPIALSILRFRSGSAGLWEAFKTQFTWLPFFLVFFGGLSYHISTALMSHLIGYNMVCLHLF
jgi:hypothetical protein